MIWMTVDPGISGTGYALFKNNNLIEWGIIYPKGKNFIEKANYICEKIPIVNGKICIEYPTFQTMAAQNTQSIPKLAFLIGRLWTPYTVLIPVSKWRGNCPKKVLWKRAEKYFGKIGFINHAGDAVALGQYCLQNKLI